MAKILELFDAMDFDTQTDVLANEANATREYAKKLKSAFNRLTVQGQGIIAMLAETLSNNPDYHMDYEEVPPDEIWLD